MLYFACPRCGSEREEGRSSHRTRKLRKGGREEQPPHKESSEQFRTVQSVSEQFQRGCEQLGQGLNCSKRTREATRAFIFGQSRASASARPCAAAPSACACRSPNPH